MNKKKIRKYAKGGLFVDGLYALNVKIWREQFMKEVYRPTFEERRKKDGNSITDRCTKQGGRKR